MLTPGLWSEDVVAGQELKAFSHTDEAPEAVGVTIPATFDMMQSNATKEAGYDKLVAVDARRPSLLPQTEKESKETQHLAGIA